MKLVNKDQPIKSIPATVGYDLTHCELFQLCQLLDQQVSSLSAVPVIIIVGRTYHEVCNDIRNHNGGFSPEYNSTLKAYDHVLMFNLKVENRKRLLLGHEPITSVHDLIPTDKIIA